MLNFIMLPDMWIYILIGLILFFIYPILYPYMLINNAFLTLKALSREIEEDLEKIKNIIVEKAKTKKDKKELTFFLDFFAILPTSLDPFGIVRKIEFIVNKEEKKLRNFVDEFSEEKEEEKKRNIEIGIVAAIEINNIKKIVEHFAITIKKFRNVQLAMLAPLITTIFRRKAKALYKGAKTILDGFPIGDSIGNLIVTYFISKKDKIVELGDCIIVKKKIENKNVIIIKAKGPGSRLGKLGRVVESVIKKEKPKKIITIDAAAKLEGEKTGSIAIGVGVAIGGIGVDKFIIEEIASKYDIDVETIVIKMSDEEAICPMSPEILNSKNVAIERLKEMIRKSNGKILIVGVGNSVGIPNYAENLKELEKNIIDYWKKHGEEKEKKGILESLFEV